MKKTILLALAAALGISSALPAMVNQQQDFFNFDDAEIIEAENTTEPTATQNTVPSLATQSSNAIAKQLINKLQGSTLDASVEKLHTLLKKAPREVRTTIYKSFTSSLFINNPSVQLNDTTIDICLCDIALLNSRHNIRQLRALEHSKTFKKINDLYDAYVRNFKQVGISDNISSIALIKQLKKQLDQFKYETTLRYKAYNSVKNTYNNNQRKIVFSITALITSLPYIAYELIPAQTTPQRIGKLIALVLDHIGTFYLSAGIIYKLHLNPDFVLNPDTPIYIIPGAITPSIAFTLKKVFDYYTNK